MVEKKRKLMQKKLDALYIVHNPVDCLIIYFCVCFTFIRIIYDFVHQASGIPDVYVIALVFTVSMGCIMILWAHQAFKNLNLVHALQ